MDRVVPIMLFLSHYAYSQKLVESVAGIVGNEVIYLSDVENGIVQEMANGNKTPDRRPSMQAI